MDTTGACRFPGSFVLTALRGQLVLLQGIWFIQIAEILFKGLPFPLDNPHMCSRLLKV